jgi:hypothetical protein
MKLVRNRVRRFWIGYKYLYLNQILEYLQHVMDELIPLLLFMIFFQYETAYVV